jgi:hypothetical protein
MLISAVEMEQDSVVQAVIDKFAERAKVGHQKYGTTMDRTDLTRKQWLQHLQEELMDAVVYAQKLLVMIDGVDKEK